VIERARLPSGYRAAPIDEGTASEGELARLHRLHRLIRAEAYPDDPPPPVAHTLADAREISPLERRWAWIVTPTRSDEVVGFARVSYQDVEENRHLTHVGLCVDPAHRRRGLARHLLGLAAELTSQEGRRLLNAWTVSSAPGGEAFAEAMGAKAVLSMRESELNLDAVDRAMVRRWVEEGPRRAADYELLTKNSPVPAAEREAVARVFDVMNDAPRDSMDYEDDHFRPEEMEALDRRVASSGVEWWMLLARHRPSQDYVGLTNVWIDPANARVIDQGDTGVHRDHRGHALGKWLKAAMLERIFAERPMARIVRTGNAYSNDAMLGINNALGFQAARTGTTWELDA